MVKLFKDKNILVVGAGNAGRPAANLLNYLGNNIKVTDINSYKDLPKKAQKKIDLLREKSIEFELGNHDIESVNWADVIFISPNIPQDSEFIQYIMVMVEKGKVDLISTSDIGHILNSLIDIPMIGVSGTDGKTTTTNMINHSLNESYNTLIFSSIQNSLVIEGLVEMVVNEETKKRDFALFELPHGTIRMVEGLNLRVGVLTNLTPDHLDEFKSYEDYIERNIAIKDLIQKNGVLIMNGDDPIIAERAESIECETILYGLGTPNKIVFEDKTYYHPKKLDVIAKDIKHNGLRGSEFKLVVDKIPTVVCSSCGDVECNCGNFERLYVEPFETDINIKIPGQCNIENTLANILVSLVLGFDIDSIKERIQEFTGVEGRFEKIDSINGIDIFMDAAHNPESMEKFFEGIEVKGRLIISLDNPDTLTVRDKFRIGEVLSHHSDVIIVSAKNETTGEVDISAAKEVVEGTKGIEEAYMTDSVLNSILKALSITQEGDTIIHMGPGVVNVYNNVKDDIIEAISFYKKIQGNVVVMGGCGNVGSLMARVLKYNGADVTVSDLAEDTHLKEVFNNEGIKLDLGGHSKKVLKNADTIFITPKLIGNSKIKSIIRKYSDAELLDVNDILKYCLVDKPVIGITGTNGKTTTTEMIKNIFKVSSMEVPEHMLNIQGNTELIPALQVRLKGDVAVVEIGTFGNSNEIRTSSMNSEVDAGIITNISKDHLDENGDFAKYVKCKRELGEVVNLLILNSDDPLVSHFATRKKEDDVIFFGIDDNNLEYDDDADERKCPNCGKILDYDSNYLDHLGLFKCSCGFERKEPDVKATDIGENTFTLKIAENSSKVKLKVPGISNIYNALAAATGAHIMNVEFENIVKGLEEFNGVSGRFEEIQSKPKIIVDFAHNPAGVKSVIQSLSLTKETKDEINADCSVVLDNDPSLIIVNTVSSESGKKGDIEIAKLLNKADYVIPVSESAKEVSDYIESNVINIDSDSDYTKKGTLGADYLQVKEGLEKALDLANDSDIILIIGEGGTKFAKEIIKK